MRTTPTPILTFTQFVLCSFLLAPASAFTQISASPLHPVGIRQLEFTDTQPVIRHLPLTLFYPAEIGDRPPEEFVMPFFTSLQLYKNAAVAEPDVKRALIMFSHGRGGIGLHYAWFAQFMASNGYIVAAINHYRANTYDSTILYLANRLWQRPVDIGLGITFLLNDDFWGSLIDANRIAVAGHSQGGFTALWIGGATVDPDEYLAFQRHWRNDPMVPEHLRTRLPLDAQPALNVQDDRVKAVLAMAPGIVKAFGMDEAGLGELSLPTYVTVGAADTQAPPKENAEFAAEHIPNADLDIIPGAVGHEIFVNECTAIGKDEFPEACIDAPGIDRREIHQRVGKAALDFFEANLAAHP